MMRVYGQKREINPLGKRDHEAVDRVPIGWCIGIRAVIILLKYIIIRPYKYVNAI